MASPRPSSRRCAEAASRTSARNRSRRSPAPSSHGRRVGHPTRFSITTRSIAPSPFASPTGKASSACVSRCEHPDRVVLLARAAHAYIMSSEPETMSMVLLEASASGLPTVAVEASCKSERAGPLCRGAPIRNRPRVLLCTPAWRAPSWRRPPFSHFSTDHPKSGLQEFRIIQIPPSLEFRGCKNATATPVYVMAATGICPPPNFASARHRTRK